MKTKKKMNLSAYGGMLWAGLKKSGAMPDMGDTLKGGLTWEEYKNQVIKVYNTFGDDMGEATKLVGIPVYYASLNKISFGCYSKGVALVAMPLYWNDDRMVELLTGLDTYLGLAGVLTIDVLQNNGKLPGGGKISAEAMEFILGNVAYWVLDDSVDFWVDELEDIIFPEMVARPGTIPLASPLILDLDGDGVETVSVEDGVYFDHDGNRYAEKTGWAGSDDAFLVWDGNGNGQIDDGSELFGDNSILANGEKAANGFEALAEFDSNNDGIVNADDERWSELKLWQDANGNGTVDDGEMLTMEEAGVAGLNVDYTEQSYTDENGNEHRQSGSFIRADGTTAQMTDVWFAADASDTQFMDEINVSEAIAANY